MIDVYPKERRLVEYSKRIERLIEDIASRTNTTVTGKAQIEFIKSLDDAQKAYTAYKYPKEIIDWYTERVHGRIANGKEIQKWTKIRRLTADEALESFLRASLVV